MPSPAKNGHCALARANHVSCTDEKRIRTGNTVIVNTKPGVGVIQARTTFRPSKYWTIFRPRNIVTL